MNGDDAARLIELAIRSKSHWGYTDEQMAVFRHELTMSAAQLNSRIAFGIGHEAEITGFYTIVTQGTDFAELEHIFIDSDYLRQGLGRRLLHHAMSHCEALGIAKILVLSDPNAAAFCERCGARLIKQVPSSIPGRSLPQFQFDLSTS